MSFDLTPASWSPGLPEPSRTLAVPPREIFAKEAFHVRRRLSPDRDSVPGDLPALRHRLRSPV